MNNQPTAVGPTIKPNRAPGEVATASLDAEAAYEPQFQRTRWAHGGTAIDRFFDAFVPRQYELGFAWRCRAIGQGQEARVKEFNEQNPVTQKVIAANAEVLLELFEETASESLDRMRDAGKRIMEQGILDPSGVVHGDIPELRDEMGRRHHIKWREQYHKDVAAGTRQPGHSGDADFEELSPLEQVIMKVQTWGNWRILAALSDDEYAMIRGIAERRVKSSVEKMR